MSTSICLTLAPKKLICKHTCGMVKLMSYGPGNKGSNHAYSLTKKKKKKRMKMIPNKKRKGCVLEVLR